MQSSLQFTELAAATIFAAGAASALQWLFLLAAFRMMRPATARQPQPVRSALVSGTRELVRRMVRVR